MEIDYEAICPPTRMQIYNGVCFNIQATAAAETAVAMATSKKVALSVQQSVDCIKKNHRGCYPNQIFNYIETQGLHLESDYSQLRVEDSCSYNNDNLKEKKLFFFEDFKEEHNLNDEKIQDLLDKNGPIICSIVHNGNFAKHTTGLYTDIGPDEPKNHALLVVGYGLDNSDPTDPDHPYIRVQNSQGDIWGTNGFANVSIKENTMKIKDWMAYTKFNRELDERRNRVLLRPTTF